MYFKFAFHDDAASLEGLQTKSPLLELVEASLSVVEGCVQIPPWHTDMPNKKTLGTLLRAVVRLQYRKCKVFCRSVMEPDTEEAGIAHRSSSAVPSWQNPELFQACCRPEGLPPKDPGILKQEWCLRLSTLR